MNNNLWSRVAAFLKQRMRTKRWRRAMTCLAAVVVFGVTYALVLPAITMTGKYPVLSAETLTAWTGDELAVKVSAEADEMDGGRIVVLTLEGEGADLSASYAFNEEGVCVITDEEQKEIELHRAVREGTKNTVDYWFALEPGDKTVFTLNLADEVDETRFAETMQAVRQSSEEAETEAEKATASDAGKSAAVAKASGEKRDATASNAEKASVSNADVAEANKIAAEKDEEKILTESDESGFEEILDGAIINDLEGEDEEDGEATEIIAELKVSAGIAADYEKAVKDAEKNADKRGNAQLKFKWKDVVVTKASAPDLVAYVNGATIAVFCDENSGIPADAVLSVEEILEGTPEYEEYLAQTKSAVANATGSNAAKSVTHARFFDITILDADGSELEPETPAKVVITYDESIKLEDDGDLNVAHLKEDAPELLKPGTLEKSGSTDKSKDISGLSFTADSFSVYAVFGTEILTTKYLASNGDTYSITVTCPPEAGIPSDAHLEVREIKEGEAEYAEYAARTAEALSGSTENMNNLRLFDISILSEAGQKLEPAGQVDVKIEYVDPIEIQDQVVSVVHFAENKTEVIDPEVRGKSLKTADEFTFATASFSIYAIVTQGVTGDLDGKTLAITQVRTKGTQVYAGSTSQANTNYLIYYGITLQSAENTTQTVEGQDALLQGLNVVVDPRTNNRYLITGREYVASVPGNTDPGNVVVPDGTDPSEYWSSPAEVTMWTFEKAGGAANQYYIKAADGAGAGKYLQLSATGVSLADTDTPMALTVTADGSRVTISTVISGTTYYLGTGYLDSGNTKPGIDVSYFRTWPAGATNLARYNHLTLCDVRETSVDDPVYTGEKISVQEIEDFAAGSAYLIYKTVYDNATGQYETYVIDGAGKMVYAYENGDSISLHSAVDPRWFVSFCTDTNGNPNGYYIFKNATTGKCLRPSADGTFLCEIDDFTTMAPGVQLPGRSGGDYTSGIQYWNDSVHSYRGMRVDMENGKPEINTATIENSTDFYFAEIFNAVPDELHEVETVSSVAHGITIHMFDYPTKAVMDAETHPVAYANEVLQHSRIGYTLVNGIPRFYTTNTHTGSSTSTIANNMFNASSSPYYRGDADHLFLAGTYNSTGYYEYTAYNNYAMWNGPAYEKTTPTPKETYNFTVYEEIGSPGSNASTITSYTHNRGEFFPYNELSTETFSNYLSLFAPNLLQYDLEDPNYGGGLHIVKPDGIHTTVKGMNYYHGMTMEFRYMMPKDGLVNGEPMIYEFDGDDDLYIFVDGVLLLDIGGIHNAWEGNINFATGQIYVHNYPDRSITIKQAFKRAGVFPDGTAWDDSKVDKYFTGNTFKDFTGHSFKMFYAEHGANASNLLMRFNLPAIEEGQFTVKKELMGTDQQRYANVPFAYKTYKLLSPLDDGFVPGQDTYVLITSGAKYGMKVNPDGTVSNVASQNIPIVFDADGTFYLKPGETAVFAQLESVTYHVEELGIGAHFSDLYPRVYINDTVVQESEGQGGEHTYACSDDTVGNRPLVVFKNECGEYGVNDLRVKKVVPDDVLDVGDMFEYRVLMETTGGMLRQYEEGPYYVLDPDNNYCKYENGAYVSVSSFDEAQLFHAGVYGSIARIPNGYTFEIQDILAGTHFYVDEIRVNEKGVVENAPLITDTDWDLTSRTTENADPPLATMSNASVYSYFKGANDTIANLTADETDKEQGRGFGVIGRIQEGEAKPAKVTFTNNAGWEIQVQKIWGEDGGYVSDHGDVTVALFKEENGQLVLVPGTERVATPTPKTVTYKLVRPEEYTMREVIVDGDTVTPVDEGGKIVVTGEGTLIGTGKDDTYFAAYSTSTASDALVREDTVTNTMYPLYLRKVDPNGNALQGAIFQLTDGQGAVVPGYESFESGEDGVLLNNAYLSNGTYYLEEIKAPDGFIKLPVKIAITVSDGEAVYTAISTDRTAPRTYENATDSDAAYEFVIDNNPGTELPSTGGPGTALYTLSGLMLLITSALLYGFRRRHEERRSA